MPDAAYCSACRRYVLVADDGGCEAGHPRPKLRGLYDAELDRRTGRPKPPRMIATSLSGRMLVAPAAPRVTDAHPPRSAPRPSAPPVLAVQPAPPQRIAYDAIAEPVTAPSMPFADQLAAPPLAGPDSNGFFARLFGQPRGRHSKGSQDAGQRMVVTVLLVLALGAALGTSKLVVDSGAFDSLAEPAVLALAP